MSGQLGGLRPHENLHQVWTQLWASNWGSEASAEGLTLRMWVAASHSGLRVLAYVLAEAGGVPGWDLRACES